MEKIFVLGAGTMGAGIVQAFAQKGYEVIVRDIKDEFVERGLTGINKNLSKLVSKGKMTEETKEDILSRISGTTDMNLAADCDLVVEAAIENMKIKKEIFAELDKICKPETILASNTSSLSSNAGSLKNKSILSTPIIIISYESNQLGREGAAWDSEISQGSWRRFLP